MNISEYGLSMILIAFAIAMLVIALALMKRSKVSEAEQAKKEEIFNRAQEEAILASAATEDFTEYISHDIRTSLNGIAGLINIARSNLDDPQKVSECLDKMSISSGDVLLLINDLTDMGGQSRLSAPMKSSRFSIHELVSDCLNTADARLSGTGVSLMSELSRLEGLEVIGDELHLHQAILHILENATEAASSGSIISFHALGVSRNHESGKGVFSFEIVDTGRGIPPEEIEHMWHPFTGEHYDSARVGDMGMAIASKYIQLMGGSISVHSDVASGTVIKLSVPLEISAEAAERKAKGPVSLEDFRGTRIMVVEDNELNMDIASEILTEMGFIVIKAWDGKDAVNKFSLSSPGYIQFILMDIVMPVMDGLEAARAIRALDRSDAATVPIIATSANIYEEDRRKSIEAGMNAHLPKPLVFNDVITTMSELL